MPIERFLTEKKISKAKIKEKENKQLREPLTMIFQMFA
jgi:hypothetical protein